MEKETRAPSNRQALLALILLALVAWLPGFFTLPPLDRDESRFAQAAKQMLESGNFVDIKLGEQNRYEKPAGIYWMEAATTAVLGLGVRDAIWTYRVPSLLGALAAAVATFYIGQMIAGVEVGFAAGAVLALSVLLMTEAKIAKTDAMLCGMTAIAELAMLRVYLWVRKRMTNPPMKVVLTGWAAFGIGVLIKGPVIALVCGLSTLIVCLWDRDASWLKRLHAKKGIAITLIIVLPWLIAIGIASHGMFFQQSLGQDFGGKMMGEAEAHGAPPGYFTLLAHLTLWPGSIALLPALLMAWKRRDEPGVRYLISWVIGTWLMFEIVPTKLPHYVLPAYPALAVLCGLWIVGPLSPETMLERIARYVSLALFVGVGLTLAVFFAMAPSRFGGDSPWWLFAGAAIAIVAILATLPLSGSRRQSAVMAGMAAVLLYQVAGYGAVPRLPALWLSPRMAEAVTRHAEPGDPPVVTAGYAEPSISFLLGTQTKLVLGADAASTVAHGGLALVDEGEKPAFLQTLRDLGVTPEPLEEIDGINYSRGRQVRITLYRVAHAAP